MPKLEGFEFWRETLGSPKYIVAPMVDASELAWRMLSRRYGATLCYTPMLHSNVFQRDPGYRRDALATCPGDRPLIVQFCANDPETLLKAAKLAEDHCDAIDINLGCPQQIARRGHYGAFLQDEWDLIANMISVCHKELKVPITAKMRVFDDIDKTIRYAQMMEKAGAQLLTVHGRTREMKGLDTGLASWKHIKAVRDNVKVPVVANGNIQYLADVDRCIEATGAVGVMSAEGNLFNPALFHGLHPPVWQMCIEYLDLVDQYPCPMSYVRGHVFKIMVHALNKHKQLRENIGSAKKIEEIRKTVLQVQEDSQPDVDRYNADPENYKEDNGLPFPYWLCQPYVRPSPEEREVRQKDRQKNEEKAREIAAAHQKRGLEDEEYSKNKLKKIKRNPHMALREKKGRDHYVKCENGCGNIRGMNCRYHYCKTCCRSRCFKEVVDCVGHKNMVKTKLENRLAWEAKQREITENKEDNNLENSNNTATDTSPAKDTTPESGKTDGTTENIPMKNTAENGKMTGNLQHKYNTDDHEKTDCCVDSGKGEDTKSKCSVNAMDSMESEGQDESTESKRDEADCVEAMEER